MIYLTCKKIPDGENTVGLYQKALASFRSCPENAQYINAIRNRCDSSAKEGLFALCLLAELVKAARDPLAPNTLTLARADSGKPYFISSDLQFNISHSGGYVAVALSDEGDVGIDVETADITPEKAQKLAKRFFTEAEQRAVSADTTAFLKLWSKKEATAKYLVTSLSSHISLERRGESTQPNVTTETHTVNGINVTVCRKMQADRSKISILA